MNTLHEEGKDHDEEDDPNSANSETPISQGPISQAPVSQAPVSQAVEIRGCDTNGLQYAVPYTGNNEIVDRNLLLTINRMTFTLCIFNLAYLFVNFGLYVLRCGLMLFCLYHGVIKRNIYAVNIYISEATVNIFFVRPLLIVLWFHYDRMFILFFESIQIPFECYLLLKLITLRRKLIEHNQIPFACHAVSDVQVAVYDAD